MLEVGLTLRRKGWQADWIDTSPVRPSSMIFRGAPGSLTPRGRIRPGYLHLSRGRHDLEMHNSLQYRGMSGSLHEVDISVLAADEANECRRANNSPVGLPYVGLELKHYSGDLSIGLTRSMLMATTDLALLWSNRQMAGRLTHQAPGKTFTSMGNIDGSISYVFTTAENVGASERVAPFYGTAIASRVRMPAGHVPGHHPEIDGLCDQINAMFP